MAPCFVLSPLGRRVSERSLLVLSAEDTEVQETRFWRYVYARQLIFDKRRRGEPPPWTADPILSRHRFTNVYRAADRVSQYLIRSVLYSGSQVREQIAFRSLLFRIFNQPATWQVWLDWFGHVPTLHDWHPDRFTEILDDAVASGVPIWNNAYMITPPLSSYGGSKHAGWLRILDGMMESDGIRKVVNAPSLRAVYHQLLRTPTVGPFFAFQWTTDLNYSTALAADFDENSYVVPGDGAKRGARRIFGPGVDATTAIQHLTTNQVPAFARLGVRFPWLGGRRKLHLMDIQNCLCEFDKYSRVAYPETTTPGRYYQRIKQRFDPVRTANPEPIAYWYPPKWEINEPDVQSNQETTIG